MRKWIAILVLLGVLAAAIPASAYGTYPHHPGPMPGPWPSPTWAPTGIPGTTPSPAPSATPSPVPSMTPSPMPSMTPPPIPSVTPPPIPSMTPPPIPTVPAGSRVRVIQGRVEAISSTDIVVRGHDIKITDSTEFVPDVPSVGDLVTVVAKVEGRGHDRTLTALVVTTIVTGDMVRPIQITGIIQVVTDTSITIRDRVIEIDSSTVISGSLEVGFLAHVTAVREGDSLKALAIITVDTGEAASRVAFAGIIDAIVSDQEWVVSGITVTITADTRISGETPAVGKVAVVEGTLLDDGTVQARRIVVSNKEDALIVFEGVIQSIGDEEWTVGGRTFEITPDTVIDESKADAQVGRRAVVTAIPQPDGLPVATYIRIERR